MADVTVPIYTPDGMHRLDVVNRPMNTPAVQLATTTVDVGKVAARGSTLLIFEATSNTDVEIGTVGGPGGKEEKIAFNPSTLGGSSDGLIAVGPLPDYGFRQSDGNIDIEMPASGDVVECFALDVSAFAAPRPQRATAVSGAATDFADAAHVVAGGPHVADAAVFAQMVGTPQSGGFEPYGSNMLLFFYQTSAVSFSLGDTATHGDAVLGRRDPNLLSMAGDTGVDAWYTAGPLPKSSIENWLNSTTNQIELAKLTGTLQFFCTVGFD